MIATDFFYSFFFSFQKAIISAGMMASFNFFFYIEVMHHGIHLRVDYSLQAHSVISPLCLSQTPSRR